MTEAEWLACDNAHEMYARLGQRMTPRQRLLFSVACGRRCCRVLPSAPAYWLERKATLDALCLEAIRAAEEQCDGADREARLRALFDEVSGSSWHGLHWDLHAAIRGNVEHFLGKYQPMPATAQEQASRDAADLTELVFLADLFREIVGYAFRPLTLSPSSLTPAVVSIAQVIYDENRFDEMPVLADALEDTGCTSEAILAHCRADRPHVRGCWVLDLILGKR